MPRSEKIRVTYESDLRDGVRDSDKAGVIYGNGPDRPFRLVINRVTETEVHDGRGRNWSQGGKAYEEVASLTLEEAGDLVRSLVDNITFAAMVAERRVLIPTSKEIT